MAAKKEQPTKAENTHTQRGDCWCGYKPMNLLNRPPEARLDKGVYTR